MANYRYPKTMKDCFNCKLKNRVKSDPLTELK